MVMDAHRHRVRSCIRGESTDGSPHRLSAFRHVSQHFLYFLLQERSRQLCLKRYQKEYPALESRQSLGATPQQRAAAEGEWRAPKRTLDTIRKFLA